MSGMFPADLNALPAFVEWRGGVESPWDEETYLYNELSLASALVLSRYLFPKIVGFGDGYFIEDMFDRSQVEEAIQKRRIWNS